MACEGTYARGGLYSGREASGRRGSLATRLVATRFGGFLTSPRSSAGRLSIQELAEYRCEATGLFDLRQMSAVRK